MAPPVSSLFRAVCSLIVSVSFCATAFATTFPLPIPTRTTTFPLSRPSLVGEVVVWGANDSGQTSVPVGLTNVVAVSAGHSHIVALRNDGTVVSWGDNGLGQTNVPTGLNGVVAISAGGNFSLALDANGKVTAWGDNTAKQCNFPGSTAVAIAAGYDHALALTPDGQLIGWGNSAANALLIPAGTTNVIKIAAGPNCSAVLLSDGTVLAWGAPNYGPPKYSTTEVADVQLDHGDTRLFALRRDGTIVSRDMSWADWPLSLRPVAVRFHFTHGVALNGDGTVTCWGRNSSGETNVPPRLRSVIDIAAGYGFSVALKLPSPPIPTTARALAQDINGFVVGLNIIDGGEGYAVPPQVAISGGGGSGATATAQISRGVVTGFTVTNAGVGYTSAPTVEIEPPPFLPKLSIATSRVGVTMQVVPGKRYQLESSNDLPNFGAVGAPFVADKETISQEFVVSETGQFFRIVETP